MAVIIDGTNGITTPPVALLGSTSGTISLVAPAVAGTNTQTLVAATGTLAPLISGTAVASTSGTSIDFTSIPSWVKRVTVMFSGVSTNGTSIPILQLGTTSGIENTGYAGTTGNGGGSASVSSVGFNLAQSSAAAYLASGVVTITLVGAAIWVCGINIGYSAGSTTAIACGGGNKTLSGTLDRIRITTVNGTDTFDAGSVNIMYE